MPEHPGIYLVPKVLPFPGKTKQDIAVERVCDAAKALCTAVLILGEDPDGFYIASSTADKRTLLWWIEMCKKELLDDDFNVQEPA